MGNENNGNNNVKGWLLGATIGAVVGSVTALLFAPKSGRELRKDIADGARQASEKTQEIAEKVSEQGAVIVDKVKSTTSSLVQDIQNLRSCKNGTNETDTEVLQVSSVGEDADLCDEQTAVIGVVQEDSVELSADTASVVLDETAAAKEEA